MGSHRLHVQVSGDVWTPDVSAYLDAKLFQEASARYSALELSTSNMKGNHVKASYL